MIDETLEELRSAIDKAHTALKRDLSRLRTGRANPDALESIRVDYYGSPTPINQLATVTVPEPRLLVIKPWDKASIIPIERAIQSSPLELSPQNDGELIRIPIPMLTEERRRELVKLAKRHGEECRVSIRKARHDAKDMLGALEKDGDVGRDEAERAMKKVEAIVQEGNAKVDAIVSAKEKDVMEL